MPLAVNISTESSRARKLLGAIAMGIDPDGTRHVAGRAGVNIIKGHLRGLDRQRSNKLGGKRSHFYSAAAAATSYHVVSGGAVVSIAHQGFAQRYYGGTIRPVNAKALAIPARPESYGRLPSDFSDLFVMRWKGGSRAALVRTEGGALRIYFWLVKSVTQRGDPTVLPSEEEITSAVYDAIGSFLRRRVKGKSR